jgi:hypothetical protein
MRHKTVYSVCPVCGEEAAKNTYRLDERFLEEDRYKHSNGELHIDVMYQESLSKRVSILTAKYASQQQLTEAFMKGSEQEILITRAKELCPAIDVHEKTNLAMMKDLPFEPRDVSCVCVARPGQPCYTPDECEDSRAHKLEHFLIWLAEQRHLEMEKLTKKRITAVAQMLGYSTAIDLYYRAEGVVIVTPWSTHDHWRLYVGGKIDPTKFVWMTRRRALTKPERGPFRNEQEIALALRAVGRGE